jgi:hypothetical protein
LASMVEAWPQLRQLHLFDHTDPLSAPTTLTLADLLLITGCKHLQSLSLRIDATSHIPPSYPNMPISNLRSLCVSRSPGLYSSALSLFYQAVFPRLCTITYGYSRHHSGFGFDVLELLTAQEQAVFECWRALWNDLANQ